MTDHDRLIHELTAEASARAEPWTIDDADRHCCMAIGLAIVETWDGEHEGCRVKRRPWTATDWARDCWRVSWRAYRLYRLDNYGRPTTYYARAAYRAIRARAQGDPLEVPIGVRASLARRIGGAA